MAIYLLDTTVIIDALNGKRNRPQIEYYPVISPVPRLAGLLKRDYRKKGITLTTPDVTVAAVAIHHQLILMTDNLRHYPMKQLSIYPLP